MAKNIISQVVGGKKEVYDDVCSVGEVRSKMGLASHYAAAVNGEPAKDTECLSEGDVVTFAEAVKGA